MPTGRQATSDMEIYLKKYLKSFFWLLIKRVEILLILGLVFSLIFGGLILYNNVYKKQDSGELGIFEKKIDQEIYEDLVKDLGRALLNVNQAMSKEYPDPFR